MAAQLAHWGGATIIGTVRQRGDLAQVNASAVAQAVALDEPDPVGAIRAHAPGGVDRIIEVAFSDNIDLDATVAKNQAVIAAYASRHDRPGFPFWPMLSAGAGLGRVTCIKPVIESGRIPVCGIIVSGSGQLTWRQLLVPGRRRAPTPCCPRCW